MADTTWQIEFQYPEEDTWSVHKGGYGTQKEAQAALDVYAEWYRNMNWRVSKAQAD